MGPVGGIGVRIVCVREGWRSSNRRVEGQTGGLRSDSPADFAPKSVPASMSQLIAITTLQWELLSKSFDLKRKANNRQKDRPQLPNLYHWPPWLDLLLQTRPFNDFMSSPVRLSPHLFLVHCNQFSLFDYKLAINDNRAHISSGC